ncbi:hypothetical protein CDL12_06978 [Handroanthus impetiginosus]|uniref:Ninja-family protein n=1 Tax=Handroanthus impetiginosus TaxID=429701 RepID=A0A2G9HS37_9LAMI|nr:hypothetical protein CDL12_06978 [Handroanthus impetiginosus]
MAAIDDSEKITRTAEMKNLSLDTFSSDLFQRFVGSANEEDEEIELNLGLSLGGRFGVDKSSKKLMRSSSIASCLPVVRDDNDGEATPRAAAFGGLARTSSLPVETEEEWRKRKELQSLRRMAAKRRRSEKQRNLKGDREGGGVCGRGSLSLESKGGSSSRVLELEMKGLQDDKMGTSRAQRRQGTATNALMDDMPSVFTKGCGPNGKRVDGILYKYGRGEDVRIMCICHGNFHSPAEFIKHAGGVHVDHPLKHIVVNWDSSSLFM